MTEEVSRRDVLRGTGAGLGAVTLGAEGVVAQPPERHIIGTETRAATEAARQAADSVYRSLDFGRIGQAVAGVYPEEALAGLRQRPDVRYIEPDGQYYAISIDSNDAEVPWGVDRVDAEKAHDNGNTGSGADIAIIDTGIDDDHPDLNANIGEGKAFVKCRGRNCNYAWSDDNDHGTHCAGIADAVDNGEGVVGVSTEATLHAVKVLDKQGSGSWSDIAAGIEWTANQGYDVGSLSLGGSSGSQTVKDACRYADNKGVLLVAAAGNDGPCSDCVSYPAAYSECIAVSATSKDDSLASFSSTGSEIELAAPGENIESTVIGGYDTFSGTSMACPHVSGAGGQLMANGYTNTDARDQLQSTAGNIGLDGNEQGNGLLDVEAALGLAELSVDSLSATEVETSDDDAEFDVSWEVSDPDGNLDTVDLVLRDTTNSEDEDTATISVSGDTANGTERMVATGDEGSSNSYDVTVTVTDGDSNTDSKTVSVSETESAPTVETLSLSEVEVDDADNAAEFDADWSVSDEDGDLDSVDLTLYQLDSDGSRIDNEDSASEDVSGDSATGTTRLIASGDDGSGNTYEVEVIVSDTDGDSGSDTATETESESTSSAPTIDTFSLTDTSNPRWARVEIDWAVSDADGDLSDVTSEATFDGGTDSQTSSVSGSSASGTHELRERNGHGKTTVTLTVTDSKGNSTSKEKTITLG